jgi:hypothetical protein
VRFTGAETQIRQSVYSAVVVLYSKMRLDKQASYTMTLMRKANLTPSLHAYNMLLQLLVKLKSNDKVCSLASHAYQLCLTNESFV